MPDLTPEAWAQIRYDYEHTDRPVEEICAEHGISSGTLRDRMRRWRWRRRRPPIPAEGPPAVAGPIAAIEPWSLGLRMRSDEGDEKAPWHEQMAQFEETPTPTLPLSGGGSKEASARGSTEGSGRESKEHSGESTQDSGGGIPKPSAAAPPDNDAASIGARLQSAVAHVLPALEATLARLAGGPMQLRHMEQVARALGSLTRTLRELNGLLAQYSAHEDTVDSVDTEELRRSIARRVEALAAQEREARPRRYVAAWNEFAAAQGANSPP